MQEKERQFNGCYGGFRQLNFGVSNSRVSEHDTHGICVDILPPTLLDTLHLVVGLPLLVVQAGLSLVGNRLAARRRKPPSIDLLDQ